MALISCPACGKQVSEQAPTCPQCGQPIAATAAPPQKIVVEQPSSGGSRGFGWLLLLLLLGGGAFVLFQTDIGKQLFNQGQQIADSQRILGKWKQQDGSLSLEFFSDGTLLEERLLNNGKGTYKLLPNRKMELKIEGVLWGTNDATARYDISGDELTLTPDAGAGIAIRYRKVK
ncbi:zinc ribbon domain-containing protein [Fimbriiglobus ruber]|uniref:zinc ribbon domain-containing protein n=1 Tax=Fimbriiglobus ruber TaxID=1908690 RepID=UPI000B4A790F|nr:zinc ribbon domain-containing protein [Fimbriiglobus ruber]